MNTVRAVGSAGVVAEQEVLGGSDAQETQVSVWGVYYYINQHTV